MTGAEQLIEQAPNFSRDEFPGDVLRHMDPAVIAALVEIRQTAGVAIYPSPVYGAHVRHDSSGSRHSTHGGTRKSDATDCFVAWSDWWTLWPVIQRASAVGGIGLYTEMHFRGDDMGQWAMFHIDCRPKRIVWLGYRDDAGDSLSYIYEAREPRRYYSELAERVKA